MKAGSTMMNRDWEVFISFKTANGERSQRSATWLENSHKMRQSLQLKQPFVKSHSKRRYKPRPAEKVIAA
jgi:hypothetical protein